MNSYLTALDPGLLYPAVAIFKDGILDHASRIAVPKSYAKMPLGERIYLISERIVSHIESFTYTGATEKFVIEWPQIYPRERSPGDPNDLPPLAGLGMCVAAMLDVAPVVVRPHEWAGNTPKAKSGDPWASVRGQMVWDRLSENERNAVLPSHDSIDAVGLGLHYLNRFARRRVYDRS